MVVELRELRYFLALVEELHFTRAAARVYVTQPAFSRAIRKLEREVGEPLFDRSTRQVGVTRRGAELVPIARDLLARAEAMSRRAPEGRHRVRVALCTGAPATLLPGVFDAFKREHPEVALEFREVDTVEQVRAVADGEVDACLGLMPVEVAGQRRTVLALEPRVALVAADDPIADAPSVTVADVIDHAWLPADPAEPPGWDAFFCLSDVRGDPGRRVAAPFDPSFLGQIRHLATLGAALIVPASVAVPLHDSPRWGTTTVPVADASPGSLTLLQREDDDGELAVALRSAARAAVGVGPGER